MAGPRLLDTGRDVAGAWPRSRDGAWAAAIVAISAAAVVLSVIPGTGIARAVAVLLFVTLCPGISLVRLVRLENPLAELALGIGLSLALAGIVSGAFLYANAWSPEAILGLLVAIAMGGVAIDLLLHVRPGSEPARSPSGAIEARLSDLSQRPGDPVPGPAAGRPKA
jgi:hypothetical protein